MKKFLLLTLLCFSGLSFAEQTIEGSIPKSLIGSSTGSVASFFINAVTSSSPPSSSLSPSISPSTSILPIIGGSLGPFSKIGFH